MEYESVYVCVCVRGDRAVFVQLEWIHMQYVFVLLYTLTYTYTRTYTGYVLAVLLWESIQTRSLVKCSPIQHDQWRI